MGRLEGRIALVTGSSPGIGSGVAEAFARAGSDVAINHPTPRQRDEAEAVADRLRSLGRRAVVLQGDVASEEQVTAMFARAAENSGHSTSW